MVMMLTNGRPTLREMCALNKRGGVPSQLDMGLHFTRLIRHLLVAVSSP